MIQSIAIVLQHLLFMKRSALLGDAISMLLVTKENSFEMVP